jgi:hypothetical protein
VRLLGGGTGYEPIVTPEIEDQVNNLPRGKYVLETCEPGTPLPCLTARPPLLIPRYMPSRRPGADPRKRPTQIGTQHERVYAVCLHFSYDRLRAALPL